MGGAVTGMDVGALGAPPGNRGADGTFIGAPAGKSGAEGSGGCAYGLCGLS